MNPGSGAVANEVVIGDEAGNARDSDTPHTAQARALTWFATPQAGQTMHVAFTRAQMTECIDAHSLVEVGQIARSVEVCKTERRSSGE